MALSIVQKLDKFQSDPKLQAEFEDFVRQAWLPDLLWPERRPKIFPAKFRGSQAPPRSRSKKKASKKAGARKGRDVVYPLMDVSRRLDYVAVNLDQLARTMASHPAVAYLYLTLFQEDYRPPETGRKRVTAAAAARAEKNKIVYNKVQRLKRRLVVSPAVKRARNRHDLSVAVLAEFDKQTEGYYAQRQQIESLEIELEMHRKTLGLHSEDRKRIDELVAENANLNVRLTKERERSAGVEQELSRLAEQVLHGGPFTSETQVAEEYQQLRHEHGVLSQKYDALISKNIELSNRLERAGKARALEEVLNTLRDKINGVLRSGLLKNDDALLASIQGEIAQLQRARIYLGRALYDVGMLYLRSGDRKRALAELRAARELGVESADTNRIIGSIS
ncbi:MAG: hypothetical protein NXI24_20715 [bacterium]|nr:hypothetical protein [bacterium]